MHTTSHTTMQETLYKKLHQALLPQEDIRWYAYPDPAHLAKRAPRLLLSSWARIRLVFIVALLLVLFLSRLTYPAQGTFFPMLTIGYGLFLMLSVSIGIVSVARRIRTARIRLRSTIYAITSWRVIVMTIDRAQCFQNAYAASDMGRIDIIERNDGWGDIVIGSQQRVVTSRLAGVADVRNIAQLLTQFKTEHIVHTHHETEKGTEA